MSEEHKINEETNQEKPEEMIIQAMEKIVSQIIELSNSSNIIATNKEYKALTADWNTLLLKLKEENKELENKFWEATKVFNENYDWALWANFKKKEEICDELNSIFETLEKKELVSKFDELKSKWREIGIVPNEKSKELVEKYKNLCQKIQEKSKSYFDELEEQKKENLKVKTALCEKIESLVNPENWNDAAEFVRDAQKNWNGLGAVPKETSDEIWKRFQEACNLFFTKLKEHYKDVKKHQKDNLKRKRELCEQVEQLKTSNNWKDTSIKISEIQKEWKTIGPANKKQEKVVWGRFKSACDEFFHNQKHYFEEIDKERPENLKKKEELCKRLENMDENLSEDQKYKLIIDTQKEWKSIGPVPKDQEQLVWGKFRKPIDAYFQQRKEHYEEEKKHYGDNLKLKEELCIKVEELESSTDWQATREEIKSLQKQWNEIGRTHRDKEKEVWARFKKACDVFFSNLKEFKNTRRHDLEENLNQKIDLCFQAEIISGVEVDPKASEERAKWQLKKLTQNFWYKVLDDESWESKAKKIKELQKQWKLIGTVPKNRSQEIWERFQKACNYFFEKRK